ncbi:branched-chain amino acid ABC transporter permease [Bradyrhizobium sp. USDA 4454]
MMARRFSIAENLARNASPIVLCGAIALIVLGTALTNNAALDRTVVEALVRIVYVVGLYIFVGNSGVISFGHTAFMAIGAYATAWQDCCSATKPLLMPALPKFLLEATVPPPLATILSGVVASIFAAVVGLAIVRLSGIGASIATFAVLAIVNVTFSNWDSMTAGTSTLVGIPNYTDHWFALLWVVIAIFAAHFYQTSRFGLSLRVSREDEVAAKASGVSIFSQRLIAFVISAFFVGVSGALYAHFLGTISVDAFYIDISLLTLAMLVVGGMNSLTGAVVGVGAISLLIEVLRQSEHGFALGSLTVSAPRGTQEIGLGVAMLVMLIFRRNGIAGNQEIGGRLSRFLAPQLKRISKFTENY